MKSEPMLLTEKSINKLPFADLGQYVVRDSELGGFYLNVGKRTKSYMVHGEFWEDGVREFVQRKKVGVHGAISAREARNMAKEILLKISRGVRSGEAEKPGPKTLTLQMAWHRYRDAHMIRKGRAERTIENYTDYMERLLEDWLQFPLARLSKKPNLVSDRHEKISVESGPYIANSVMKALRAIYNHALRANPKLPTYNPVLAVDWNPEYRRSTGMGEDELCAWFEKLFALGKPLRREFHLLTLLTGSRPGALKEARIEHLNFQTKVLHIPKPKGGNDKAFDIPLSREMIRCIIRAIRIGRMMFPVQSEYWIFPGDSASGHMVDHKEDRNILPKWGNDLRQTYRTIAQAAGVSELDVHLLMNHSLRGVNAGYITRDRLLRGHLRKQQQRISDAIFDGFDQSENQRAADWCSRGKVESCLA